MNHEKTYVDAIPDDIIVPTSDKLCAAEMVLAE